MAAQKPESGQVPLEDALAFYDEIALRVTPAGVPRAFTLDRSGVVRPPPRRRGYLRREATLEAGDGPRLGNGMRRIHILGRKNHGKTQLVTELVEELTGRGWQVGTIKHTHHRHELDTPGKDSHRHRVAGSAVVGILSPAMTAVFVPSAPDTAPGERYAAMAPLFAKCDLVLVEGDTQTDGFKIEVWRAARETPPLAIEDPSIRAVVTDDPLSLPVPLLPRSDVPRQAAWILARVGLAGE